MRIQGHSARQWSSNKVYKERHIQLSVIDIEILKIWLIIREKAQIAQICLIKSKNNIEKR